MSFEPKVASFSVVVTGAMNPSIHHPVWYRHVGLLSEQEEREAIEGKQALLIPLPAPMAQFETGLFQVSCQQNRWQILTANHAATDRIVSIAETLFDEILPHTQVTQFGYNFDFVFDIAKGGVGRVLGRLLCAMPFDLGIEDPTSGEWKVAERRDRAIMSIALKPGTEDSSVAILTNYSYVPPSDKFALFKLADFFKSEYSRHQEHSEQLALSIAERLASRGD